MSFDDARVIVTGGTRGIGRAISLAFAARGAEVTATYAQNEAAAETLVAAGQGKIHAVRCDVGDPKAIEAFYAAYRQTPTVLINNAGIRRDAIVGLTNYDDWRRVLAVNLDGTFLMTKHAIGLMSRARYGRIVQITSPSARLGIAGQAAYAASKAGQEAFGRALAKEVATRNITVNAVEPGFVETELLGDLSDTLKAQYRAQVPQQRFGTPEEIAAAVLFLASREAAYITATTLRVAGGL